MINDNYIPQKGMGGLQKSPEKKSSKLRSSKSFGALKTVSMIDDTAFEVVDSEDTPEMDAKFLQAKMRQMLHKSETITIDDKARLI